MTDRAALLDLAGIRIFEDTNMVERTPYPRSPSRAKRRAPRGFLQHTRWTPMKKAYQMPGGYLVMHPSIAAALRAKEEDARG